MEKSFFTVRGIIFSAMFAAILVAISFVNIHLGFTSVQITLVNFVIMLIGGLLGAKYGLFSVGTVILLTLLGVPLLHGNGGLSLLLGKTGGFIWMYPVAAFFIGLVVPKIRGSRTVQLILIFLTFEVFGSLLLYVAGIPWFAHVTHFSFQKSLSLAGYPFLPGDAVKALIASIIVVTVREWAPLRSFRSNPASINRSA